MKLMNKETFNASLKDLVTEIGNSAKDFLINFKMDDSKEESSGALTVVFTLKLKRGSSDKKNAPREYKISMYVFESHKAITTFIVNGRTLQLLFENSTMNSHEIALHYLKEILNNEIKFARELEDTIRKQKEEASKKRMEERRKPRSNRNERYDRNKTGKPRNGSGNNYKGKGGKKPYNDKKGTTHKIRAGSGTAITTYNSDKAFKNQTVTRMGGHK